MDRPEDASAPPGGEADGRAASRSVAEVAPLPVVTNASLQARKRCKTGPRSL
jgi:hypothetical protein